MSQVELKECLCPESHFCANPMLIQKESNVNIEFKDRVMSCHSYFPHVDWRHVACRF